MIIKKILKIGCLSLVILFIVVIILGTIGNILTASKREKLKVQNEIQTMIETLNQEAPYQVGVAMWFTGATHFFMSDTLTYNYELRGNKQMEVLYVDNEETIRNLTLLGFRMANEQWGSISIVSDFLRKNKMVLEDNILLPSGKTISFYFTGEEIDSVLSRKDLTSEKALMSYMNIQMAILNEALPIVWDEGGNVISSGGKENYSPKKYQILRSVVLEGKDVIYNISIPEITYNVSDIKTASSDSLIVSNLFVDLSKDETFKGILKYYAMVKCNMILRYKGAKSAETVDICFPYELLRQNTYIPEDLLD